MEEGGGRGERLCYYSTLCFSAHRRIGNGVKVRRMLYLTEGYANRLVFMSAPTVLLHSGVIQCESCVTVSNTMPVTQLNEGQCVD